MENDFTALITELIGLIVPAQWDKNGDVTGLALSCRDESEYTLLMDRTGRSLTPYIHKEVVIKGVSLKEGCKEIIKVISFWER